MILQRPSMASDELTILPHVFSKALRDSRTLGSAVLLEWYSEDKVYNSDTIGVSSMDSSEGEGSA